MCGLGHCGASFFCSHHLVSLSVASCPSARTKLICVKEVFLTLSELCAGVTSTRRAPVSAGWPGEAQNCFFRLRSIICMGLNIKQRRALKGNVAKAQQVLRENREKFSHGDDTPVPAACTNVHRNVSERAALIYKFDFLPCFLKLVPGFFHCFSWKQGIYGPFCSCDSFKFLCL